MTVCENRYISSHKVTKGFASRGKSTKGWFFGFKLQGICTADCCKKKHEPCSYE
ncbi:MAG: hypothetical protein J5597_04350 [Spirochaetaceae bacterium]|nr:hypothetical protein [Spirochaetaceae bacterium]